MHVPHEFAMFDLKAGYHGVDRSVHGSLVWLGRFDACTATVVACFMGK